MPVTTEGTNKMEETTGETTELLEIKQDTTKKILSEEIPKDRDKEAIKGL